MRLVTRLGWQMGLLRAIHSGFLHLDYPTGCPMAYLRWGYRKDCRMVTLTATRSDSRWATRKGFLHSDFPTGFPKDFPMGYQKVIHWGFPRGFLRVSLTDWSKGSRWVYPHSGLLKGCPLTATRSGRR